MKKIQRGLERVKSVIDTDRLNLSKEYTALISYDVEKLLSDYFELSSYADLKIETNEKGYKINITCTADRLKPYNFIPKSNNG